MSDYANDAYRACLEGRADRNQQQSVASQVILLNAFKGRALDALVTAYSFIADEADNRGAAGSEYSDYEREPHDLAGMLRRVIAETETPS